MTLTQVKSNYLVLVDLSEQIKKSGLPLVFNLLTILSVYFMKFASILLVGNRVVVPKWFNVTAYIALAKHAIDLFKDIIYVITYGTLPDRVVNTETELRKKLFNIEYEKSI